MRLKKIILKNIRSYKEGEIVFPEGSILLAGDVGSGKTSILLALEYALFGLQPGQRGASLLRNNTVMGEVILDLEIEGKDIIIERKLKRGNKGVTNEYASVTINGQKAEASLTEIKIKILELIGYPLEFIKKNNLLYRYTVYTQQEHMKQILIEDPDVRLNILRHILGIDKYKRIRENLGIFFNYLREESKLLNLEIRNLDDEKIKRDIKSAALKGIDANILLKIKELEEKIESRRKIEEENYRLEDKIKEKIYLEKEAEKAKIMISNKYDNIATINIELNEVNKTIFDTDETFNEEKYLELVLNIEQNDNELNILNSNYANFITELNFLDKQNAEMLARRERVFKIDMCPTCLQDVPEIHKHNILNETEGALGKTKQRISNLQLSMTETLKDIEKKKLKKRNLEEQRTLIDITRAKSEYVVKAKNRKQFLIKNINTLEQDLQLLNKHLSTLKEKILESNKYDQQLKMKKEELSKAYNEERKADISLAEIKKEMEILKKDIQIMEESIKSKESIKRNLDNMMELQEWLSSSFLELIEFIERNVLLKLRQEFSRVFSKWFHMLVSQGVLNVRLDESFSPIILHRDIEMDYSFLSGGERTAIALAYRLALNQTINSILSQIKTKDIVILDEPTDGFSEIQLDKMREVLNELKVIQLIIVSHERRIEGFVDNLIRIKKTGDSSYLEQNNTLSIFLPELNHKT